MLDPQALVHRPPPPFMIISTLRYCAMYGESFVESGKQAFELFHSRGLDAIINDALISNVFTLMGFGSGVLTALVGYVLRLGSDG